MQNPVRVELSLLHSPCREAESSESLRTATTRSTGHGSQRLYHVPRPGSHLSPERQRPARTVDGRALQPVQAVAAPENQPPQVAQLDRLRCARRGGPPSHTAPVRRQAEV